LADVAGVSVTGRVKPFFFLPSQQKAKKQIELSALCVSAVHEKSGTYLIVHPEK
jgi:hypothetical protein